MRDFSGMKIEDGSYDFRLYGSGSIYMLYPLSDAAKEWVEAHLPEDRQTFGGGVAVEPRYISDIVQGVIADGLSVVEV